ncbi:hypothetical protein ACRRTK_024042 [Alexandromys fortis]
MQPSSPAGVKGHTQQPLVPGASARARPWALLNVCAPGSPALLGKGEEWLSRALDRQAGRPRNREGSGGRGSWPVEEEGGEEVAVAVCGGGGGSGSGGVCGGGGPGGRGELEEGAQSSAGQHKRSSDRHCSFTSLG